MPRPFYRRFPSVPSLAIVGLSLLLLAGFFACQSTPASKPAISSHPDKPFTLFVMHTNDVHAHVLPINRHGTTCSSREQAKGNCFGGLARLQHMVNQLRQANPDSLLLDAGDMFQGTLFYTHYHGQAIRQFMNLIGYDAMTLGNHEFDNGSQVLASFIDAAHFPVLSANVDAGDDAQLAGKIAPYTVVERGGRKIGIIGLTIESTRTISSPGKAIRFTDGPKAVAAQVEKLTAQGITHVILLSHAGIQYDRALAESLTDIDLIIGGHSHSLFSNRNPKADAPYPLFVKNPAGISVPIVSAGSLGRWLGALQVQFDATGRVTAISGEPIELGSDVPEDPQGVALAEKLSAPFAALRATIVGRTDVELVNDDGICRFEECLLGDIICDAMLEALEPEGVQIAFYNGGGIRSSIAKGDISLAQVHEVLPFGNLIATATLSGADVLEVLEHGVSRADDPNNDGTGRFLQVAGLRYRWDPSRPVGSRIVDAEIKSTGEQWAALDPQADYRVATSDFTRRGGDGYTVFTEKARNTYDFGKAVTAVVIGYLKQHSPLAPSPDGRIQIKAD